VGGGEREKSMQFWFGRRLAAFFVACAACGLAACSGNLGSGGVGGGLPAAPGGQTYQQPQGPGSSGPTNRERAVEGAVFVTPDLASIPLPTVDGFSLVLALSSPAPSASPSEVPSGTASSAAHGLRQHASRVVQVAQATPPSPTPSAAAPASAPSAAPSPVGSGAASAGPSASPKPGKSSPSPHPTGKSPKIDTKLVIYPNYAPDAPTPEPTGNVQTYTKRDPIVRGYISPAVDVVLYGLGAARFTIPTAEQLPGRGYTIAIFASAKHKKPQLIANDTSASIADDVVSSSLATPLTLKKGTGYDIVLYGDALPSTPPPVSPGYATPGSNPFVSPTPAGYPQMPGQPYPGAPNGMPTYAPPGTTPTPFPTH
jgi:hypothetical protein